MALTTEQLCERQKYVCSSDAAAVLGVDAFDRTASDVWLEKTGKVEPFAGNEATKRGQRLEGAILDYVEEEIGKPFARDVMVIAPDLLRAANFDGIDCVSGELHRSPSFIAEAKSAAIIDGWGDEIGDVPDHVNVQVHHAMHVAGPQCRVAHVGVLHPAFRRFEFKLYRVERDDALADDIAGRCVDFMERYVKTDTPPPDYRPSLEVVKRIKRVIGTEQTIPDMAVTLWRAKAAVFKQAEKELKEAQAALIASLGTAEVGVDADGVPLVTYKTIHRAAYPVAASSYRQLRYARKEAKVAP